MNKRIVVAVAIAVLLVASAYAQTTDFFELVKSGTPQDIQAAIKNGAKVNARDTNGVTALLYAARYNQNPDTITTLLKAGADIKDRDMQYGATPLMIAARYNQNPEVITMLLKAGADVNEKDKNNNLTPLMYAAGQNPTPEVITTLLKAGADVNAHAADRGDTALIIAARINPNPKVVSLLIEAGADVNAQLQNHGDTALIAAARSNARPEVISLLLKAGADVNAQTVNSGDTALIVAARGNAAKWVDPNPEVISLLLKAGADVNARDNAGYTARDFARFNHHATAVYELLSAPQSAAVASLELKELSLDDVYPVFYAYYDTHPLGKVVLSNTSSRPIKGIKVSFQIKEFMADPKDCPAPSELTPGESKSVDLFALLLPTILETTEKTKTQARVDVEYTIGGQVQHQYLVQSIPILDRNATNWTDDRRVAAFVTVKDPTVLTFSKNVNSMVKGKIQGAINPNLLTAIAFFQTLQLFGLTYSQDPIPTTTANRQVADFILFPRQTLQYKGGKCSDFSVLYCALLESVGIETAFITIPGHILIAFSIEVGPDEARKAFSRPDGLIFRNEKSWIPVEMTESAGFLRAWQDGAKEWRENLSSNQAAFYPLHEAWQLYEPVAFPGAEVAVDLPPSEKIVGAYQVEAIKFINQEIFPLIAALESQIKEAKDPRKPTNELGVLYARYGQYDQAQKEFESLLAKDEYVPALVNMGNILYLSDQREKALEYYNRAYAKDPENPRVLLAVAKANHALENYGTVKKVYAELKTRDLALARQFSYLDLKGEEATRAANVAGANGVVVWEE